jgi:hypothetical protein
MYMWAGGIDLCYLTYKYYSLLEEFEDIKGVRPKIQWPGDLMGDQMYHFIHLTLMLFSTPTVADVIDYLEYISNISENNKLLCNY